MEDIFDDFWGFRVKSDAESEFLVKNEKFIFWTPAPVRFRPMTPKNGVFWLLGGPRPKSHREKGPKNKFFIFDPKFGFCIRFYPKPQFFIKKVRFKVKK